MMKIEIPAPEWLLWLALLVFIGGWYAGWKVAAFWTRSNAEMEQRSERNRSEEYVKSLREQHRQEREAMQQRHQEQYNRLWAELVALKNAAAPPVPAAAPKPAPQAPPSTPRPIAAATAIAASDDPRPVEPPAAPPAPAPAKPQQRGIPRGRGAPRVEIERDDDFDR